MVSIFKSRVAVVWEATAKVQMTNGGLNQSGRIQWLVWGYDSGSSVDRT